MQKGIIKNVNRITGEPIDAKDLASLFSGIIGEESGVLTVFDELHLEKINDNKVRLHSGVYSLKGHILYIPKGSYEDFDIESGTLGANRIDLLVAEFVKNGEGDGEDTLQFKIVKGETSSGNPQSPDLIQQDINENGITRQEVLYELRLTGVNLSVSKTNKSIMSLKENENKIDKTKSDISKEIEEEKVRALIYKGSTNNLDSINESGFYMTGQSTSNKPSDSVYGGICVHMHRSGQSAVQLHIDTVSGQVMSRGRSASGIWGEWV